MAQDPRGEGSAQLGVPQHPPAKQVQQHWSWAGLNQAEVGPEKGEGEKVPAREMSQGGP